MFLIIRKAILHATNYKKNHMPRKGTEELQ